MKNHKIYVLAVLAIAAMSFRYDIFINGTHSIDTESSEIVWNGKKVTGEHFGTIKIKSGKLDISEGVLTGGNFLIDMSTITSTDLSGEYLQKLNGHLKSDDFFGVEKHPTAAFVIKDVETKEIPGEYKVTGNLTIKEITKSIQFDAQLTSDGNSITAVADIVVDRSEFDVRYGSGSFFDDLGDKTIYDDFYLHVNLITQK